MAGLGTLLAGGDGLGPGLVVAGATLHSELVAVAPHASSAPFPYIATTAGWMTTELGRQPWLVYGLLAHGRRHVAVGPFGECALHACSAFSDLYLFLGLLFIFLFAETFDRDRQSRYCGHGRRAELEEVRDGNVLVWRRHVDVGGVCRARRI